MFHSSVRGELSVSRPGQGGGLVSGTQDLSGPEEVKLLQHTRKKTKTIENVAHQHPQLPTREDKPVVMLCSNDMLGCLTLLTV